MTNKGFHHLGLATNDMDGTKKFYEDVLGFETVRFDRFDIAEGGYMRHLFMDAGGGELISFLEANEVPDIPTRFDAGISAGLGVPNGFFHIAFEANSVDHLQQLRQSIESHGVEVSPVTDHDWCKSIYLFDPVNGLSLEYSLTVRELTEDDRAYQYRFTAPKSVLDVSVEALKLVEKSRHEQLGGKLPNE